MPILPPFIAPIRFTDPAAALAQVQAIYQASLAHLREAMRRFVASEPLPGQTDPAHPSRVRACYPFVRVQTESVAHGDSRLSYGFVAGPGRFETTLTRPDLYGPYYLEQFRLLLANHGANLEVGTSNQPIPVHFSFAEHDHVEGEMSAARRAQMRDVFDLPDLAAMDDGIANGTHQPRAGEAQPLALFTAPRVDYSLQRLRHYTGTAPEWFQNFVLFTNYQFYIDEFIALGRAAMADPASGYVAFVEPGNLVTRRVGLPAEAIEALGSVPPPGRPKAEHGPLGGQGAHEVSDRGGNTPPPGRPKADHAPLGGQGAHEVSDRGGNTPPPGRPKADHGPLGGQGAHEVSDRGGPRLPQMPAYHLMRADRTGITMVNIGVGPANAKTITDHIAVLRPHAWIMLGHCAGLRNSQQLGDYVLAHGYVREDHVLDEELPLWVPIPALAEVQVALETAVAEVTQLSGHALKRVLRTGTVASTDNRNWELLPDNTPQRRFSQSRAIALDMESATIAANGFRFRVPYGTLLCVSDKPLHGEIKLPGMANHFYRERVNQHLLIGLRTIERLREAGLDQLHSRKLRSFAEVAFQ